MILPTGFVACIGVDELKQDRLSSWIGCGFQQETRPSLPQSLDEQRIERLFFG
tara:strand:- start:1084 stop:1242 length:159 start_codon:yes stop_codon:yes gene_type:complete